MKKAILFILSLFSASLSAEIQLSPLNLTPIGKVAQFDLSENEELILINQQGDLWKIAETATHLASGLSPYIEPKAQYGRIAAADKKGHFTLWTPKKHYSSEIPLSPNATMEMLHFATIAVTKHNGEARLVRIETAENQAEITAMSKTPVLPDAHPLQIHFESESTEQGHIAILAKPDNITYQHAVLGDDIEAAEVQFLERHSLDPLVKKLSQQGLVFEANQFATFTQNGQTKLVSVMSGDGAGAKVVLVYPQNGKLVIEAESEPLPSNRWQSPFSFNGKLYAVQMPHLRGNLVEFTQVGKKLEARLLASGLSNHRYGDIETNLAATTPHFAVIPKAGYRNVVILDKSGKVIDLPTTLPAEIQQSKAGKDNVYLRLKNGEIWVVGESGTKTH